MSGSWNNTQIATTHYETSGRHLSIPVQFAIPAGDHAILLLGTSGTSQTPVGEQTTDNKGNLWTPAPGAKSLLPPNLFYFIHSAPITNGLVPGDVISFDLGSMDVGIHLWDAIVLHATGLAVVNGKHVVDAVMPGSGSGQPSWSIAMDQATTQTGDLLVGGLVFTDSVGRTCTLTSSGTFLGPVVTTSGGSDKKMYGFAKTTGGPGVKSIAGTFDSAVTWCGSLVAFAPKVSSPPIAALVANPTSGNAPLTVALDASGSTDPAAESLTYAFDFGDGQSQATGSSPTASHSYANAGTYTVQVTVTNTDGISRSKSVDITVTGSSGGAGVPAAMVASPVVNGPSGDVARTSFPLTLGRKIPAGSVAILGLATSSLVSSSTFSADEGQGNSFGLDAEYNYQPSIHAALLSLSASADLLIGDIVTSRVLSTESGLKWNGLIMEATGVATGAAHVGAKNQDTGSATTFSVTVADAAVGDLIVGMLGVGGSGHIITPDAGITASAQVVNGVTPAKTGMMLWRVATVAGPQTISGSFEAANRWAMGVAVYPAAGGAVAPPTLNTRIYVPRNGVWVKVPQPVYPVNGAW